MIKCNVVRRSTQFVLFFFIMGFLAGNSYAQTCVPGTIATGQYDPRAYTPSGEVLGEYGGNVDNGTGGGGGGGGNDDGGNVDGGNTPIYEGGPAQTIPPPECMRLAWDPTEQEIASCTTGTRDAYVANGPGGLGAVQIRANGNRQRLGLAQCIRDIPGANTQRPQAARVCVQTYFPDDGSDFLSTGGRLSLGLTVDSGEPVPNGMPGNGGTPPFLQNSASIRLQRQRGRAQLYSYHLDRGNPGRECGVVNNTPGYLGVDEDGNPRRNVPYYHYGCPSDMRAPFPVGEWFTLCQDVVMNTYDANGRALANGMSSVSMYDSEGMLLGTAGFNNVVYSRDPSGYVKGVQFTEKWNNEFGNTGADSNTYYRNYQIFTPDTSNPACN